MNKLILLMWNKEQLPTEWLQGIICQIYKKGERTICSNYRPITLLNIAYKIFTIILNNRLSEIVESKLSDVQSGFRPNTSTFDNIFIVCQTFEKFYEYSIDLHNIFVDYIQAFDSINRNKVLDSLNQYNIPSKLKKLIALTLRGTNAIVKINKEFTEKFDVHTGVEQEDPLSDTFFSMATDSILKKMELSGNISTRWKQCTACADD